MGLYLTLFFIFSLLIGIGFGFLRGWLRTGVRLGTTAVSFILSALLANPIGNALLSLAKPFFDELLNGNGMDQISSGSPTLLASLEASPKIIAVPLVFLILFFVLNWLLLIVYAIVSKIFVRKRSEEEKPGMLSRGIGAGIGLIQGLICAFATVIVVAGFAGILNNIDYAVARMDNQEFTELSEQIGDINEEYARPITDNAVSKACMAVGGEALFRSFKTVSIDSEKAVIDEDLKYVLPFLSKFLTVTQNNGYTLYDLQDLTSATKDLENAPVSQKIAYELLESTSEKWLSDSSFLGLANPAAGTEYEELFNEALEKVLSGSPEELTLRVEEILNSMGLEYTDEGFVLPDITDLPSGFDETVVNGTDYPFPIDWFE